MLKSQLKAEYRHVFKVTGVFGGVQFISIILVLLKSKVVALFLGTSGYGIVGLLQTPLTMVTNLASMGLNFSGIRDISEAHELHDDEKFGKVLTTYQRLIWLTALGGMASTVFFARLLSEWSFGHMDYAWAFRVLSLSLLFAVLSGGLDAFLRGTRNITYSAKSTIWGASIGLLSSVPCYYYGGEKGIVPAILFGTTASFISSLWFARKVRYRKIALSWRESFSIGKKMISIGGVMAVGTIVGSMMNYGIVGSIRYLSDLNQVGLFSAGWSITHQYVGLIFSAMAADYYPRLSGLQKDQKRMNMAVTQQAEIALLIITPILILYLLSIPVLIPILLSKKFISMVPFTHWIIFGMLFKTMSWAMSFMIVAKGETKVFFCNEMVGNLMYFSGIVGGFYLGGLEGVGIGFLSTYVIYAFVVHQIVYKRYGYRMSTVLIRIVLVSCVLCSCALLFARCLTGYTTYLFGSGVLLLSVYYSLNELNKRMDLKEFIHRLWNKK